MVSFCCVWITFRPSSHAMLLLVWQPFSPNCSEQNLSKSSRCWSIDDITHSSRSHYVTSGAGDHLYKWFPSRERTSPITSCQPHAKSQVRRLRNTFAQSRDCANVLRFLRIVCTISRLARNFAIPRMRCAISRLRKFLNCAEHIYPFTSGAGKTTTFSILTGDITMSSGTAVIAGYDIRTHLRDVSYLCFLSYLTWISSWTALRVRLTTKFTSIPTS